MSDPLPSMFAQYLHLSEMRRQNRSSLPTQKANQNSSFKAELIKKSSAIASQPKIVSGSRTAPPINQNQDNLDRYARKSKPPKQEQPKPNTHKTVYVGPVRRTQNQEAAIRYRKIFIDGRNVFYEQRPAAQILKLIHVLRPITIIAFFALFLLYLVIRPISGYTGYCPDNAECGVYINCDEGYDLVSGTCQVSKEVVQSAQKICKAVISNLEYEYGNSECQVQDDDAQMTVPTKTIQSVVKEFQVSSNKAMCEQVDAWFSSKHNQKMFAFSLANREIQPHHKKYTVSCRIKLATQSDYFYYGVAAFLAVFIGLWYLVARGIRHYDAKRIYDYLKAEVQKNGETTIVLDVIEPKTQVRVTEAIWEQVQKMRIDEELMGEYADEHLVYWTML